VLFAWYFSDLVMYMLVATFVSMLGTPMVKWLEKKKLFKYPISHTVSVSITFFTIILIFVIFILFIVPLIIYQANIISSINMDALLKHYHDSFVAVNDFLIKYNVVNPEQSFAVYLQEQLSNLIDVAKFTNFFASLVSATGSVFMGTFIILFLSFYFLLDDTLMKRLVLVLTPVKYEEDMDQVLHHSKLLLVRYFHGILLEVGIMMTIESVALFILGVPNAILIGFMGGLMNVIPYLGPLMGAMIGMLLAGLSELAFGSYDMVFTSIFYVAIVFLGANVIDNIVLQPQIYSKSVKAHPVEIFLAIIIGGKLAGVVGMIFAVPTYTIVKVIAKQFMNRVKFVNFLTTKM
jgi:predicted PurR-regulated permease PerM